MDRSQEIEDPIVPNLAVHPASETETLDDDDDNFDLKKGEGPVNESKMRGGLGKKRTLSRLLILIARIVIVVVMLIFNTIYWTIALQHTEP